MEFLNIRKCQLKFQDKAGHVSAANHCSTDNATCLCFYEIADKLKTNKNYDIGGTYTAEQPDFWFYYTTSMCHGLNYLFNLFVLARKPGSFSLFLPKTYKLHDLNTDKQEVKQAFLYGSQTQLTLRTTRKDEHVYVKTFQFDLDNLSTLEKCTLLVPLTIQTHSTLQLDQNIVRAIKLQHDFSSLMAQNETKDFTLESNTGKKYPIHKILIAAHSPVLRSYLNNSKRNIPLDISDEAIDIIVEFLYTGTLKNFHKQDLLTLLEIAEKLQFQQLFALTCQILGEDITIDNAINVAVLAKKYKLYKTTYKVFEFIKEYPEVLTTDSWQGLQDIDLVKQLVAYLHPPSHNVK